MPWGHAAEALVQAGARESGRPLAPENTLDIGSHAPTLLAARWRSGTGALAALRAVCLALLLGTPPAFAHEGHDHAAEAPPPAADAPRRLADGRVMLAKPAQRSWQLRTRIAALEDAAPAVELPGRVVADPSAGGRVQAPFAGIVEPGPKGLPLPGQAVKAGEVLAWLRPSVAPMERSARLAEQADVAARLAVARQRAARLAQLEGSVAQKDIDTGWPTASSGAPSTRNSSGSVPSRRLRPPPAKRSAKLAPPASPRALPAPIAAPMAGS
jgi:biotin carboxyl carrier protein